MQLRAWRMEDDHGDLILRHVLLEAQVAVAGQEYVKLLLRFGEQ